MIQFDYFIPPGKVLKEYMQARNITIEHLSKITSTSIEDISNIINDKARITKEFAGSLEIIFDDISSDFWLSLEKNYQQFLIQI